MRLIDISGQKFTRYTVVKRFKGGRWECRCDCGNVRIVDGRTLRAGTSRSCGCLGREETVARETVHGMTDHPLHKVWRGMIRRCENRNEKAYPNYGGRGIRVCHRWRSDFRNFYADMALGYRPGLTIERVDNDADYEHSNCKWVPRCEQSKNRRPSSEWKFKRDSHSANERSLSG